MHNNYLTLPVILLMISNHYPLLYATSYNWVIVAIVLALGPIIRHFYNSRHAGKGSPWWTWGVAAAGMIAIALLSAAGPRDAKTGAATPTFKTVENIVSSRCSPCHAGEPVWAGIPTAPRGDPARRRRAHPPQRPPDRPQCGVVQRHAARQHHRDDARRARHARGVARCGGAGEVGQERGSRRSTPKIYRLMAFVPPQA